MDIGKKIRLARKKAGVTQRELASQLGISDVNISQIETGNRTPTLDTVQKISNAIGIDIRELLSYGDEIDRKYEEVLEVLHSVGFSIEATGYSEGPDEGGDRYYIWHEDAEDREKDRITITYAELLDKIGDAVKAANLKKQEYLRKRLDADLF